MTRTTDHSPSLSSPGLAVAARDPSAVGQAFFCGAVAAGLGLGMLAVAVLLLWIASPYPDSGFSGALHLAADLWLLAHGAELVRTETLSGDPAPIGLTPLLLSALPCWLLYRAARHALEPPEPVTVPRTTLSPTSELALSTPPLVPRRAILWVSAGYLVVGLAAVVYGAEGPVHVEPFGALLRLPVVTFAVAAVGAWVGCGRPYGLLPTAVRGALVRVPGGDQVAASLRPPDWLPRTCLLAAARAAAGATLAAVAGGALLTALSMVCHVGPMSGAFAQLTHDWSGRFAVLLLSVTLLPNAVVWATAYGLGPGFTVGAGSAFAPLAVTEHPAPPNFPLLAALPGASAADGTLHGLLAGLVPVAAGVSVAVFVARDSHRGSGYPKSAHRAGGQGGGAVQAWSLRRTALTAVLAAAGCGAATAFLAGLASGPVGTGRLADFGPSWWAVGPVAAGWTALIGIPGALLVRWWLRVRAASARARERRASGQGRGRGRVWDSCARLITLRPRTERGTGRRTEGGAGEADTAAAAGPAGRSAGSQGAAGSVGAGGTARSADSVAPGARPRSAPAPAALERADPRAADLAAASPAGGRPAAAGPAGGGSAGGGPSSAGRRRRLYRRDQVHWRPTEPRRSQQGPPPVDRTWTPPDDAREPVPPELTRAPVFVEPFTEEDRFP
ncbi:cell division protein PerM [Streptomyces sp. P1-3]|uniref:cell division protein PerM n=1 Tax=Streptomyces sp. P1-3 TaxID=3421658 RepID=UPI003D36B6CB